eukprot:SRR837773.27044.p1 GENE.SRR837773.27044~~SRR837773.27044.p1  ORF type:complete len:246 (-),score=33.84 SRR837773.27044:8-700(-)
MGASESGQHGGDSGLFGLNGCCGTNTGMLPCCERTGFRADGPGRPAQYPQSSMMGGEAPAWHPTMPGAEPSQDGKCVEGEETYEDSSSYRGQLLGGRRHGRGVWSSDTEHYSGQWLRDQRDGFGKQVWQDGRVYEGQFKAGKFHGHGRMEWRMPAGLMVYEGQYVDDLKEGQGRYCLARPPRLRRRVEARHAARARQVHQRQRPEQDWFVAGRQGGEMARRMMPHVSGAQ